MDLPFKKKINSIVDTKFIVNRTEIEKNYNKHCLILKKGFDNL